METTVSHMHDLIAVFLPASRPPSLPSVNCPWSNRSRRAACRLQYMYPISNIWSIRDSLCDFVFVTQDLLHEFIEAQPKLLYTLSLPVHPIGKRRLTPEGHPGAETSRLGQYCAANSCTGSEKDQAFPKHHWSTSTARKRFERCTKFVNAKKSQSMSIKQLDETYRSRRQTLDEMLYLHLPVCPFDTKNA